MYFGLCFPMVKRLVDEVLLDRILIFRQRVSSSLKGKGKQSKIISKQECRGLAFHAFWHV